MNKRFAVSVIATSLVLVCASVAFSQETKYPDIQDAKPMFKALPNHMELAPRTPAATLTQWNGSFKDLTNRTVNYTMVGTNPATTNVTTKTPVYIFPVKLVYGATNGNHTFDPKNHVLSNGKTVIKNINASPIFNHGVNFPQGGTNLGTTQYIDAFHSGHFLSTVASNSSYHVLLSAPVETCAYSPERPTVLGRAMNNPFGSGVVGTY